MTISIGKGTAANGQYLCKSILSWWLILGSETINVIYFQRVCIYIQVYEMIVRNCNTCIPFFSKHYVSCRA